MLSKGIIDSNSPTREQVASITWKLEYFNIQVTLYSKIVEATLTVVACDKILFSKGL